MEVCLNLSEENIPESILESLKEYSEQLWIPLDRLKADLVKYYRMDVEKHPKANKHWIRAKRKLRGELRRQGSLFSPTRVFEGFIIGESGLLDFVEILKNKAVAAYKRDPDRAVRDKLTDIDGTPLDPRERIFTSKGWKENPNYLRPFAYDDHSYARTLYGVVRKINSDYQFASVYFRGDQAAELKYPFLSDVRFRAMERNTGTSGFGLELNATQYTDIQKVDLDIKHSEVLKSVMPKIYRLSELDMAWSVLGRDPTSPMVIEADVVSIKLKDNSDTVLWLDDEELGFDQGVMCLMNRDIPIGFGEDSRVYLLGYLDSFRGSDGSEERMFVRGLGYVPIEELVM